MDIVPGDGDFLDPKNLHLEAFNLDYRPNQNFRMILSYQNPTANSLRMRALNSATPWRSGFLGLP
jgi:hypothetical protein